MEEECMSRDWRDKLSDAFWYLGSWKCFNCGERNSGGPRNMAEATSYNGTKAMVYTCIHCNEWIVASRAPHGWQFWRRPKKSQSFYATYSQ